MDYFAPINGDQLDPDRPYINANPGAGVEGSWPHAKAIEGSMREILKVITEAGIAPDPGDFTQLYQAIIGLMPEPGLEPGDVIWRAVSTPSVGFLECDGAAVSRTTYADLFAAIGTTFGIGNGTTTFNLPDIRGEFIRGWDHGVGVDVGRVFGSKQLDAFQGHWHRFHWDYEALQGGPTYLKNNRSNTQSDVDRVRDPISDGVNGTPRTAKETRPRNIALLPIIKY